MECFRQIARLIKSPFRRNDKHRILEIGSPTDFRKEEIAFFVDDDALTLHSRTAFEKDSIVRTIEHEQTTKDRIKNQVRRLSVRIARPLSDHE